MHPSSAAASSCRRPSVRDAKWIERYGVSGHVGWMTGKYDFINLTELLCFDTRPQTRTRARTHKHTRVPRVICFGAIAFAQCTLDLLIRLRRLTCCITYIDRQKCEIFSLYSRLMAIGTDAPLTVSVIIPDEVPFDGVNAISSRTWISRR